MHVRRTIHHNISLPVQLKTSSGPRRPYFLTDWNQLNNFGKQSHIENVYKIIFKNRVSPFSIKSFLHYILINEPHPMEALFSMARHNLKEYSNIIVYFDIFPSFFHLNYSIKDAISVDVALKSLSRAAKDKTISIQLCYRALPSKL